MSKEQTTTGLRSRHARSDSNTGSRSDSRSIRPSSSHTSPKTSNKSSASAAFFSNIADCDEVFNYWEPTHYLQYGYGMQTWEYSPEYAIRSWAYIKLHAIIGGIFDYIFGHDKIKVFYAIRVIFATLCALSEALFYVSAVSSLGPRAGRYLIIILLFSAGMWNASTGSGWRIYKTILWVGIGSLLAWPFCAEVGVPAALEELILKTSGAKRFERIKRLLLGVIISTGVVLHFYYVEIPQQIETRNLQLNFDNPINLCVGKEWYRFPSHYFLPDGVRLRFLKSDFGGQLPKYFLENNYTDSEGKTKIGSKRDGTWRTPEGFNDINREEMDRYVSTGLNLSSDKYLLTINNIVHYRSTLNNVIISST
ncbi:13018_t:CDS:2 [Acaulospora colombiana]|uniref:13018_t:CDS:1 n=1 Tax=Acaulospora colombiana TaxID=27376 RepID=A0ACA9LQX7_9GLOM|nr:13018_t:CDS:2 [Acaulospora colombiana]